MVRVDDDPAPLDGYERMGARDAMHALRDLPLPTLERLHTWEDLHRRRSSVLRAIRRAIARARQSFGE
jgi:hypothetical protein